MKNSSLLVFSALALILLALVWLRTGALVPPSGNDAIWFHAGLLTLIIGRFIVEYRFTRPNDVFVNCIVVFASTSTLSDPPYSEWWSIIRWSSLGVGVIALYLAWDPGREAQIFESKLRATLYHVVTRIGRAEVIFSIVFLLALLSFFDLSDDKTKVFVVAWGVFLLAAQLHTARIGEILFRRSSVRGRQAIAIAHSFSAPSIVYCRRLEGRRAEIHQIVGFANGSSGDCHALGIVIGERSSTTETRYAVSLLNSTISEANLSQNSVLVTVSDEEIEQIRPKVPEAQIQRIRRTVGTVAKGTNISQLRFEVLGSPRLSSGILLEVESQRETVLYQIIDGIVEEEIAVSDSTRAFVEGQAEQLGTWNPDRAGFDTYDWLAKERSAVFVSSDTEDEITDVLDEQIKVGMIPSSRFPANLNHNDLVLYHTAILGVTGSGKSFLTYQLIEETAARGIKVVCIDPTGDYQRYLGDAVLLSRPNAVSDFLASNDHFIGIIETSSSTIHPIKQSHLAASKCLEWCKANRSADEVVNSKPKILLVMEEAHLLAPEWNFNPDRNMQDDVSRTAQIVLQSRKYGLGFLVVAQRTANVVKSVLNQCNTLVSFQAFDETGFDFMRNYMGERYVRSLPNLKPRHGIIVGKASASRRPVMVRFSDQQRDLVAEPAPTMPSPPQEHAGAVEEPEV